MIEAVILVALLAFVGAIGFNIVRNRNKQPMELDRTMSFNPKTEVTSPQGQSTPTSEFKHRPCALAQTLRIIGIFNIFASLIIAMVGGNDYGWLIAIVAIAAGCLGVLFCYALAKCVDAADHYLKNH